ncbi:hypothetical protein [Nocardia sp. NPDC050175]|uniref:hypothetical protein n=1 Tax=Nocardia sp. NPDC050175 TaxID=3364317 RepID=UPI00379C6929
MVLSQPAAAAELPRLSSAVSIVMPGGYRDDERLGIDGFAHLREHMALRAMDAAIAPARVLSRSARTLRTTTEFDLVVHGGRGLDTAVLPDALTAHLDSGHRGEIAAIATELRDAREDSSAVVVDDALPRALGWSSGWGYGDPAQLAQLSSRDLRLLIEQSWHGSRPLVSEVPIAALADRWPDPAAPAPEPSTSADDIAVRSGPAVSEPDQEFRTAAIGWTVAYRAPRWITILDDCLRYVLSYAAPRVRHTFPNLAIRLRPGQFGERYTAADAELVVGLVTTRQGTEHTTVLRDYLETLFRTARLLLEAEVIPVAHLDIRSRLEAVQHSGEPQQRARWQSRAAFLGLGDNHPFLRHPAETAFSPRADSARLLALLEAATGHLIVGPEPCAS